MATKIPDGPAAIKLDVTPRDGYGGNVFRLDQEIELDDGRKTHYVLTSWGVETILGDDTFAVFACDAEGRILELDGIYSNSEGPGWCADLALA